MKRLLIILVLVSMHNLVFTGEDFSPWIEITKDNVNAIDENRNSFLLRVLMQDNFEDVNQIKNLLEKDADVNHTNYKGETALILACQNNASIKIIQLLLKKGARVNTWGANGYTPLMEACIAKELHELIEILLDAGAEIEACDGDGETALIKSVKQNHVDVVCYLIERGANVNHCAGLYTALGYYCNCWGESDLAILEVLLQNGAVLTLMGTTRYRNKPPIFDLIERSKLAELNFLFQEGIVDTTAKYDGWSMLGYAKRYTLRSRRQEVMTVLINNGARLNNGSTEEGCFEECSIL